MSADQSHQDQGECDQAADHHGGATIEEEADGQDLQQGINQPHFRFGIEWNTRVNIKDADRSTDSINTI